MSARTGRAHVVTTKRFYKGKLYRTHLLRRSYREGKNVKNETLGNLSHLPETLIEIIRRSLQGEEFAPLNEIFEVVSSRSHGQVQAIKRAMERLEMASLLGSQASGERELVLAMIAARIAEPATKLATTRHWHTSTLAEEFGVLNAKEDDLYLAMDWLCKRQEKIQKKLAARHLSDGGLVLYDLSSSYLEGTTCPLAKIGYSRDGKKGSLQINYGLLTDERGCPVAVSVHEGNVADSTTFLPEVRRLREDFGIEQLVMVGDRGMLCKKTIAELRQKEDIDWISALKHSSIQVLVEQKQLQMELFDERNLIEFTSPQYPGERLIACRNPHLATKRLQKREALLVATEKALQALQVRVQSQRLVGKDRIGVAVGKVINKYKVAKHFELSISDQSLMFARRHKEIAAEAALDGIYIIRTSVNAARMDAKDCVRNYKSLANVERAFRSLKSVDLQVRPIHHYKADRVRAHILLCMLAYYVQWHMREAWRELLFADTEQAQKAQRDPVAPAKRSQKALDKINHRISEQGVPVQNFSTLMAELSTIVRNCCRTPNAGPQPPIFNVLTTPNQIQRHALNLIEKIHL